MSRKLALKKLKASDLSFFKTYFSRHPDVKQKAFNLNSSIVVDEFFPNLEAAVDASPGQRAPVTLTLFGPGGAAPHVLERKVLKQQKNWRLNGELVYAPEGAPTRYDDLQEGDIAIMEFSGASVPHAVKVVLLSATDETDKATHAAFNTAFETQSMVVLNEEDIANIIKAAGTRADHPINDWLDDELLEAVAQGDSEAAEKFQKLRPGRGLTDGELKRAKANAEKIGKQGEELLNYYLQHVADSDVAEYEWTSSVNAISPYDFKLGMSDGSIRHADAKSTGAGFNTPLYLSMAEIQHAMASGVPYDIYRLYHVTGSAGSLRIAKDIASKLPPILSALQALPGGVKAEALAFAPSYFDFETASTTITFPEEED